MRPIAPRAGIFDGTVSCEERVPRRSIAGDGSNPPSTVGTGRDGCCISVGGASRNVDLAHLETENLPHGLLTYVRRRLREVDITASDLDEVDMNSPAFQIAMRHGMATAFHEMEHRLMDMETPSPQPQGTLP